VVLLALGAGTALGGLVGAFLAVPIAAAAAAAGGYAWGRLGPDPHDDDRPPDGAETAGGAAPG
jgi:predicted PurR-regulated permease PerM